MLYCASLTLRAPEGGVTVRARPPPHFEALARRLGWGPLVAARGRAAERAPATAAGEWRRGGAGGGSLRFRSRFFFRFRDKGAAAVASEGPAGGEEARLGAVEVVERGEGLNRIFLRSFLFYFFCFWCLFFFR